ncbi:MAG: ABC transporter permease [Dysgonomonas sp.]|uniref:ABC transporter permease n=1 Tax=Dysgonomonas sp. TaxID=1891233 RepID=UPI002832183A|nr:FtsX-like permease family protein [Prevotella sp.]
MIKHISKIIWTERKINAWILLELILVFCILWFCTDYLYFTTKRYLEPKGFDIEHTYRIGISMKEEGQAISASNDSIKKQEMLNDIWTIYDRIKRYPATEYISYSQSAHPYSGSWSSNSIMYDSVQVYTQYKRVTPEFFDVFKIKRIAGTSFDWNNITSGNPVMISSDNTNMFGKTPVEKMEYIYYDDGNKDKVLGVVNKTKRSDYEYYNTIMYTPITKQRTSLIDYRELCIRVKPAADKNFEEQFSKDMRDQLEIGHYYLSSVTALEKDKETYMQWTGYANNFKSVYSITAFLIINIFLGVIGSFWFRVQSRHSEIGLRIALGSSKANVKKMFIGESILLLFIASLVASIICVNISAADLLKSINVPIPDRREEAVNIGQYFINYGITFIFLAIITIVAVWYPAWRASKIQPAIALKDE